MFLKKSSEYSVVIYKKDLSIDLNKLLFSGSQKGVKEYIYVPHFDTSDEHYHIYIHFEKPVSRNEVEDIFLKTKCFVSPLHSHETALSLLNYYSEGFRLSFETSYSVKIEENRRVNRN